MPSSQVRSVVVRLEAMVAKYIRDMNRAGDATEKAFDRVHASTSKAREEFVASDRAAAKPGADHLPPQHHHKGDVDLAADPRARRRQRLCRRRPRHPVHRPVLRPTSGRRGA
ncbi:hypothetical protein G5V59_02490 [Nocardioides sp. W3-2-3]|uniref:hypothetical protein n=1 Tax=Nocardioides convexus TaxID=2712224 RepID=UPI0024187024|nr:hypothetical protein [Nocardioides convexus]NGZ99621.1 hypothetical protein [Nocardioides convexus]